MIGNISELAGKKHEFEIINVFEVYRTQGERETTDSWHLTKDTAQIAISGSQTMKIRDGYGAKIGGSIIPFKGTLPIKVVDREEILANAKKQAMSKLSAADRIALGFSEEQLTDDAV